MILVPETPDSGRFNEIAAKPYSRYWIWVGFAMLFSIFVSTIMIFGALVVITKWLHIETTLYENKQVVIGAIVLASSLTGLWIIWRYEWKGKYWILNETELCKGRNKNLCIKLDDIVEINIGLPEPVETGKFWEGIGKIFARNQFALVKTLRDNALVLRLSDRTMIILQILDLKNAEFLLGRLLNLKAKVINKHIRYSNREKQRLVLRNANKLISP